MTRTSLNVLIAAMVLAAAGCNSKSSATTDSGLPMDGGTNADADGDADSGADAQPLAESSLTSVWANTGEDKVTRDDLRATTDAHAVVSSVWDGKTISVFGARNEVVAFNLVLEAGDKAVSHVDVAFNRLAGSGGAAIASSDVTSPDGVFNWVGRNIELFYIRYLPIQGLSLLSYETYDERHVPQRMRRPFTGEGIGSGGWVDRPDHDKEYPDIAVPLELEGPFDVAAGTNQSIWVDIYIPKDAAAGHYTGRVSISEAGSATRSIPVVLTVRDFSLPDAPSLKTMLDMGDGDISERYVGVRWPDDPTLQETMKLVRNRHFQLLHRHKISVINDPGATDSADRPSDEWLPLLDGSLFTAGQGYDGPGVGTGNGVYSITTYGCPWTAEGQSSVQTHADGWSAWFAANAATTEAFVYLIDEPGADRYAEIDGWADWIETSPGAGRNLLSLVTAPLDDVMSQMPHVDIAATGATATIGVTSAWQTAVDDTLAKPDKRVWFYNGQRPSVGSFSIEDDGVALRVTAWAQHKKKIQRWFYWESTYYNNFQADAGNTNVFESAHTFGIDDHFDDVMGRTGWNYCNGDGVLMYPGTDKVFPEVSYDVLGPFASLRLKHWRRGIQDGDYLALAEAKSPDQVAAIVNAQIPKVLWEYGVSDPNDPTWILTDISWSTDPDTWESSRRALADIIEGK